MTYRLERKFFISELSKEEIESLVRLHPAMFSETFWERQVNNIYYDSDDMQFLHDNVDGTAQRVKVRVRWYDEMFGQVTKPVLELKIKSGSLGRKESYKLPPFTLDGNTRSDDLRSLIVHSEIPPDRLHYMKLLHPTLLNSYRRRYFESADHRFRITLDTTAEFYQMRPAGNAFLVPLTDKLNVILELKYDRQHDLEAGRVASWFPFRVTKSSKYVTCLERLSVV